MSAYKDFVFDLPERSLSLLQKLEPDARRLGFEATFLIMTASTAFIVPLERLDDAHPAGDSTRFPDAAAQLRKLKGAPFVESPFYAKDGAPWQYGQVEIFGYGPDSWRGGRALTSKQPVAEVLSILRNALAHGNLYTKGDPVHDLVLYSRKPKEQVPGGYKYLIVPLPAFQEFLCAWFGYVQTLGLRYRNVLEILAKAA